MAFDPKALIAEIRADLGLPEPEEPSLWQRATQPVKTLFGATQGVGGQLAGLLLPDEYEAAKAEAQKNFQVSQGDPWYKQLEAAPGLGDVLAEAVPESISESLPGKVVGPVARMAGNIAGDPTTYTPAVLSKIGNVAKAGTGLAALEGLGAAPEMISAAKAGLSPMAKLGVRAAELAPTTDKAMMMGAAVYLPDIAQGVGASASEAWKQWAAGQYGDAVATGAGGALLGGLGFMIGKGNIDTLRASNILDNWFKENHPAAAAINPGPEFDLGSIDMPAPVPGSPAAPFGSAAAPAPVPAAPAAAAAPIPATPVAAASAPTTAPPPPAPAAAAAPTPTQTTAPAAPAAEAPPAPATEAPAPAATAADEFEGVVPLGKSKVTTEEVLAAARGTSDIDGLVNALHAKFGKERNVSKQELKRYITAKINKNGALDKYWAKQPAAEAAPAAPAAEGAPAAPAAPEAPPAPAAPAEKKGFQTIEDEITEPSKFAELSGIIQKLESEKVDLANKKVREAKFREMFPGEEGKKMRSHLNAFYAKRDKLQPRAAETAPVAPVAEAAPAEPVATEAVPPAPEAPPRGRTEVKADRENVRRLLQQLKELRLRREAMLDQPAGGFRDEGVRALDDQIAELEGRINEVVATKPEAGANVEEGRLTKPLTPERVPEEPFREAAATLKPDEKLWDIWDEESDKRGGYLAQNRGDMTPVEGEVMPATPGAPEKPKVELNPEPVKPIVAEDKAEAPQQMVDLFNKVAKRLTEKEWPEGDAALGGPLKGRKYRSVQGETPTSHRFKGRATQVDTASGLQKGVDFDELNSRLLNLRALLLTAGKGIGKEKSFAGLMKLVSEGKTEAGKMDQMERFIFSQKRSNKGLVSRKDTTGVVIDPAKVTLESGRSREELLQMLKQTTEIGGKTVHDPNSVKLRLAVDDIIQKLEQDGIRPWNGLKIYEEELAQRVDDPLLRDLVKVSDVRRSRFNPEGQITEAVEKKAAVESPLESTAKEEDAVSRYVALVGEARDTLTDDKIILPKPEKGAATSRFTLKQMKEAIAQFFDVLRENGGDVDAATAAFKEMHSKTAFARRGGVAATLKNFELVQEAIKAAKKKPDDELAPAARVARAAQFEANEELAVKLGASKVFDGDGVTPTEFHQKVAAALTTKWTAALGRVVKMMDDFFETKADFAGVNVSPYVAGASKWKPGEAAKVYHNYLASLQLHGGNHDRAIEHTVYAMIHERMHPERGIVQDTPVFHQMVNEMEAHIKQAQAFDGMVGELKKALGPKQRAALDELLPEFEKAVSDVRSRGKGTGGATGTEVVPRRVAEGRAEAIQNRAAVNPKSAAASSGVWVRPTRAVPGGAGGEAGQLGGAAPVRGGAAEGKGTKAGGVGTRGDGETKVAYLPHNPVRSEEDFLRELGQWKGKIHGGNKNEALTNLWMAVSHYVDQEIAQNPDAFKDIVGKPFPRKKGEVFSLWNTAYMSDNVTTATKAKLVKLSEWVDQIPGLQELFTRYKTLSFDEVSDQVKRLLGAHSREELMDMVGKGGLTPEKAVLVNTLGNDLQVRYQRAVEEWAKDPSNPALIRAMDAAETAIGTDLPLLVDPKSNLARAMAMLKQKAIDLNPLLSDKIAAQSTLFEMLSKRGYAKQEAKEITGRLIQLYEKAAASKNPADITALKDAIRGAMKYNALDKFLAFYKGSLLGWPGRIANVGSNTGLRWLRTGEQALASGLDKVYSMLPGAQHGKRSIWLEEAKLNGMMMDDFFSEGLQPWFKANLDLFRLRGNSNAALNYGSLGEDFSLFANPLGEGKIAKFFSFMPEALNADDALAKKAAQLDYYYRETYRRLKTGGQPGFSMQPGENIWQATKRIARDIHDTGANAGTPTVDKKKLALYKDLHEKGMEIARQDTFQTDMPAGLSSFLSMFDKNPLSKAVAHTIIPFRRTPFNILKETLRRTPAGFLELGAKWGKLSQAERMDMMARPMMGTMIGGAIFAKALDGGITGGGPIDPEEEMNLRRTGWQPYSIKVGNQYISYQRLEPISSILGMAADAADGLKRGDFEDFKRSMARVSQSVTENLTNKTFLQSLEGLSSALKDPMQYMDRFVRQYQSSFVPNSLGYIPFGHLARATDPVYRQTEAWTTSPWQAKIPGLSQELPAQYNPTGDVRKREGTTFEKLLSPFQRSSVKKDPIAMASQMLDDIGSPPTPPKPYVYVKGIKVMLTQEERAKFAKAEETVTKMIGMRLSQDPSFLRLPDNEKTAPLGAKTKVDVVQKLYRKYREQTMNQMMPTLMARAREQQKNG